MDVITLLITYFAAMNVIGLFLMGLDKHKAKKHLWRIPESTLFITAVIGGSVGCIIGMYVFRHKTRRWYFVYGMPAILAFQIALFIAILRAPFQIRIM
jgi:Predicted membrane protein